MQRSYINSDCLRWMLLGSLLAFGAFFAPAGSQTLWAQGAQTLTVRSVAVAGAVSQPEIEVKTSGPVTPATQAVTGPDRIVIDFPGALPAKTLHALAVHHGSLKGVRAGLFQAQPPITRIVLDVEGPTEYQVMPVGNSIVIKLGREVAGAKAAPTQPAKQVVSAQPALYTGNSVATLVSSATVTMPQTVGAAASVPSGGVPSSSVPAPLAPPRPQVAVAVRANLLSIRADGATLAEVLYEVHRRTGADIAIPAGAEQERVVVRLGPAPGKEVIAALLNGSRFNYILVGADSDPGGFRNLLLSLKSGGSGGTLAQAPNSGQFGAQPGSSNPGLSNPGLMNPGFLNPGSSSQFGMQVSRQPSVATAADPGAEQSGVDQAAMAQAEPELETVPDEAAPEAEGAPPTGGSQAAVPQTVQPIPDGSGPQQ